MSKIIVVGKTLADGSIAPHAPVDAKHFMSGDIVYSPGADEVMPQWYRVYDSGNKGLRFWAVTAQYAQAVFDMQAEVNPYTESMVDNCRRQLREGVDYGEYDGRVLVEQEPTREGWA